MLKEREHLLNVTRRLSASGLNRGTSGNASVRVAGSRVPAARRP